MLIAQKIEAVLLVKHFRLFHQYHLADNTLFACFDANEVYAGRNSAIV
jgi:hypothetical protein